MDWNKVAQKLRAASDQHAEDAQRELLRGNKDSADRSHQLSKIFYGLHAAIEAGLEE